MRHFALYLAIALFAFGIGIFFVFQFCRKSDKKLIAVQIIKEKQINKTKEVEKVPTFVSEDVEFFKLEKTFKKKDKFKCQDKFLLTVWNYLLKEKDFKAYSEDQIEKNRFEDCSDILSALEKVDLNNDSKNEVIVGGNNWIVNGANNRRIWVVHQIDRKYKIILEESVEYYEIKKSITNGFHDILTKHHMSAASSYDSIYKFGNGKYRERKCLFVDFGTTGKKLTTTCAEENARIEKEYRENKK